MTKTRTPSRQPKAVLISDVHYNLTTLPLADAAMRQAIDKANSLNIPLIVCGDLHDTKANLRGECVNAMIKTFKLCNITPLVLVGNHCKINEKSAEHSLNFLEPYVQIVEEGPLWIKMFNSYFIPYQSNIHELKRMLKTLRKGSSVIMHQGCSSATSGEYMQDPTALPEEDYADLRVISGHYHTRQDIQCGRPRKGAVGLFSYVGNPYSLNFAEAKDPEKGYQIWYDDGLLEFVPTKLRKHTIVELHKDAATPGFEVKGASAELRENDLLWVKVTGTEAALCEVTKDSISKFLGITTAFKLDLNPDDIQRESEIVVDSESQEQTLHNFIESYFSDPSLSDKVSRLARDLMVYGKVK